VNASTAPLIIDLSAVRLLLAFVQLALLAVLILRWIGGRPLHKGLMFVSYRTVHIPFAVQVVMTLIVFAVGGVLIAGTMSGAIRFYIPEGFDPR
jgi:hypothetical protein